jgi:methionyl-tRNA synthetase
MPKTYYITTPIYYPTGKPHIGHVYTNTLSDVLARWHRLLGEEVFFTTGTDEHGQKVEESAKKAKLKPKEYTDKTSIIFKDIFKTYNISYDKFVRTTDTAHKKHCKEILQKVYDKGDIYKGKYEGWYCVACETYYTEKDLKNEMCPMHGKPVKWYEEESYFFKMSKYQKKVEEYIKKNNYIVPSTRQKFLLGRMKEGVKDLSISRTSIKWGVPLPFDKKHVSYVWFDALLNYTSSIEPANKKKFWPANDHMVAHDIIWHHSVIWLSMLFAAGIKPPKKLLVHGFIMGDGGIKMSKSLGNVIDPKKIVNKFPVDSVRYFLVREIPFGSDGNFSMKALKDRHNNELVNDLGNLHTRTLSMIEKYCQGKTPKSSKNELVKKLNLKKIKVLMDQYELHNALSEIWKFINESNKYINDTKPWQLAKEKKEKKLHTVLYNLAESLRILSILLHPFIPQTSEKLMSSLGLKKNFSIKEVKFGISGNNKIRKGEYLFTKIEEEKPLKKEHKTTAGKPISTPKAGHYIPFKEWQKMDFRVGKIIKIQNHPKADKLYVMMVDLGKGEQPRQIVAGMRPHYKIDQLLNKEIIIFCNLQPTIIRGVESNGMLLAAEFEGKVVTLKPDKKMPAGSSIR